MLRTILFLSLFIVLIVYKNDSTYASVSLTRDSVGTKIVDGKKFILHKIEAKETWYSLSRKYKVNVDKLQSSNQDSPTLIIGKVVLIPSNTAAEVSSSVSATKASPTYHTVQAGETLYKISKNYKSSIEDIKAWNRLKDNNIEPGQKLVVKHGDAQIIISKSEAIVKKDTARVSENIEKMPVKASDSKIVRSIDSTVATSATTLKDTQAVTQKETPENRPILASDAEIIRPVDSIVADPIRISIDTQKVSQDKFLKKVTESGVATWIDEANTHSSIYFALHRSAPIGTIVKVTNTMNNRSIYVKVVGILPDTGDNTNLIIKISKAAAEKLEVIDPKFQASLSYGLK